MPCSVLLHKGKEIILSDFSTCKNDMEMIALIDEIGKLYDRVTGTTLALLDLRGANLSIEFLRQAQTFGKSVASKREKSAILGVVGLKRFFLNTYNAFTNGDMKPFNTKEEALAYLIVFYF